MFHLNTQNSWDGHDSCQVAGLHRSGQQADLRNRRRLVKTERSAGSSHLMETAECLGCDGDRNIESAHCTAPA